MRSVLLSKKERHSSLHLSTHIIYRQVGLDVMRIRNNYLSIYFLHQKRIPSYLYSL